MLILNDIVKSKLRLRMKLNNLIRKINVILFHKVASFMNGTQVFKSSVTTMK